MKHKTIEEVKKAEEAIYIIGGFLLGMLGGFLIGCNYIDDHLEDVCLSKDINTEAACLKTSPILQGEYTVKIDKIKQ